MKTPSLTLISRFAVTVAVSLACAIPASAGKHTVTSGPFTPSTAFSNTMITVQVLPAGDTVRESGTVTVTPPAAPGSATISYSGTFSAHPVDYGAVAFAVDSNDTRSFPYEVRGSGKVNGVQQEDYVSKGTIIPGSHVYQATAPAPAPFLAAASGNFTGSLTIFTPIVLPTTADVAAGAPGTLDINITPGDFSLKGGTAPVVTPAQLANISSREMILSGQQNAIAGFIISGTVPKRVIVRGIGPSLPD